MQRISIAALGLAALPLLYGCANPCSGPTQIQGIVYDGFSTVRTFGPESDTEEEVGDFPTYQTPANGTHTWEFQWGGANIGPLVVVIDGQPFDGSGAWDLVNCGTFTVDVPEQRYVDESGNFHDFTLGAVFLAFGPRLEGSLRWAEAWSTADGASQGVFVAEDVQLRGYHRPAL